MGIAKNLQAIYSGFVKEPEEDYSTLPFFIQNDTSTAGTVTITRIGTNASFVDFDVYGSTDNTGWTLLGTTSTSRITATLPANGRLYLKATTDRWGYNSSDYVTIISDVNHDVCGNIMSLLYGSDFIGQDSITVSFTFYRIFYNSQYLKSAEKLVMPATTMTHSCYYEMFRNCSSLTTAPELPATTLDNSCYYGIFNGCTSLTTAPELPATTLVQYCYNTMFYACSNLNYIKAMFTTKPGSSYTNNWVKYIAASGTFVKNSSAEWSVTGVNGIPSGWTVETAAS